MKITDDEREAAYELKWMIDEILRERERAVLYARIYAHEVERGNMQMAAAVAKVAIDDMEKAFEPIRETCRDDQNAISQQKAN